MLEIEAYFKMELSPEIQEILDAIIKLILPLVAAFIAMAVRSFLLAKVAEFRSNTNAELLHQLDFWAGLVVKAIEQSELKENIERTAEEKLNLAIGMLQERANAIGLSGLNIEDYATIIRANLRDGVHKDLDAIEHNDKDDEDDDDVTGNPIFPQYLPQYPIR